MISHAISIAIRILLLSWRNDATRTEAASQLGALLALQQSAFVTNVYACSDDPEDMSWFSTALKMHRLNS